MATRTWNFDPGEGQVYDAARIELVGGNARLRVQDADLMSYCRFDTGINLDYSLGPVAGTAVGGAAIDPAVKKFGAASLDLRHADQRYVWWHGDGVANFTQQGTVAFWYRPSYNGAPPADAYFHGINVDGTFGGFAASNRLRFAHMATGEFQHWAYDNGGFQIVRVLLNPWVAVANTWYHIMICYNFDAGQTTRIFVDGVLHSSVIAAGVRTNTAQYLMFAQKESRNNSYGHFDGLHVWNNVQHVANFIPPTAPTNVYAVDDPPISNACTPVYQFLSFSDTVGVGNTGDRRYQILVEAVPQYWNGAAWVPSDGSWAQSTTAADMVANLPGYIPGTDAVLFRILMHSADGIERAIMDQVVFEYDPNVPAVFTTNVHREMPKQKYGGEDHWYTSQSDWAQGQIMKFTYTAAVQQVTVCGFGEAGWPALNSGSAGENCMIRIHGMAGMTGGADFESGDLLMSDANGRVILHTAGNYIVGVAHDRCEGAFHRVAAEVRVRYA